MITATFDAFIEDRVAVLEASARTRNPVPLDELLPSPDHPRYVETAVELIRVDLELRYALGTPPPLADYIQRFPAVFEDDGARELLAFEDYRQRLLRGDQVTPADYESTYQVSTAHWASWRGYDEAHTDSTLANRVADDLTYPLVASIEAEPADREPVPGHSWGGFQIVEELGRGTFGQTYLARQPALADRLVVLKFSQSTTEEADRLARLQHTHIVPIFSIHRHGSRTVLCMPFLGRTTLADVVRSLRDGRSCAPAEAAPDLTAPIGSPNQVQSVLRLVADLADGLSHSHRHGILHRDIKPANIVLMDEGEPLLIDFNLAVVADRARPTDVAGGTVPYMSPEQLTSFVEPSRVDHRSDIYSLGVIFYELLTRRLPWPPPTTLSSDDDLREQARGRRTVPEFTGHGSCTPAIWQMVAHCLAPDPDQRYQSADELRADILRHQQNLPLQHAPNTSWLELAQKWVRRHPRIGSWSTAALIMMAALAIFLIAWTIRERRFAIVEAREQLHAFSGELDRLRPRLVAVGLSSVNPRRVMEDAVSAAEKYLPTGPRAVVPGPRWANLPEADHSQLSACSVELATLLANATGILAMQSAQPADRDRWLAQAVQWNEKAASLSPETSYVLQLQRRRLAHGISAPDEPDLPQPPPGALASAADYLLLGLEHDARGQWAEARDAFHQAVRLSPNNSAAWLMLARSHAELGDWRTAIAQLNVCESLMADSVVPIFERGVVRMNAGEFASAASDFAACLARNPDLYEARVNQALCLAAQENDRAAEQLLTQAMESHQSAIAYLLRAKVRRRLGDVSGAAEDLEQGLRMEPTDAEGWLERGLACMATQPRQALRDFERVLASQSRAPRSHRNTAALRALHNMAHLYSERLGQPEDALDKLDSALALDPQDRMALAGRGVLNARAGRVADALGDARRLATLEIDPVTQYQLACIYALCSDDDPSLQPLALQTLAASLRRDASLLDLLPTDPDMGPLRTAAGYEPLLSAARTISAPLGGSGESDPPSTSQP